MSGNDNYRTPTTMPPALAGDMYDAGTGGEDVHRSSQSARLASALKGSGEPFGTNACPHGVLYVGGGMCHHCQAEEETYPCEFCGKHGPVTCYCGCPESVALMDRMNEQRRTDWFVATGIIRPRCDECGQDLGGSRAPVLIHTTPDGMTMCGPCKERRDRSGYDRFRSTYYYLAIAFALLILGLAWFAAVANWGAR